MIHTLRDDLFILFRVPPLLLPTGTFSDDVVMVLTTPTLHLMATHITHTTHCSLHRPSNCTPQRPSILSTPYQTIQLHTATTIHSFYTLSDHPTVHRNEHPFCLHLIRPSNCTPQRPSILSTPYQTIQLHTATTIHSVYTLSDHPTAHRNDHPFYTLSDHRLYNILYTLCIVDHSDTIYQTIHCTSQTILCTPQRPSTQRLSAESVC